GLGVALQRQGARAQAVDAYREAGRAHALLAAAPPVALLYNLGALLIDGAPAERVEGRSLLEAYLAHPDADDVRSSRAHQLLDEAPTR
ncbi:MAG: hypothetical protein KC636_15060, partial [Myxococcales bacterium]|nr:hypothetical protein [Myxococcales bacterium]